MSFSSFILRLVILVSGVIVVAGAAITFAAERMTSQSPAAAGTPKAQTLVVPSVEGQAYVFAKGILEEGGFGWQVNGAIRGYAANVVKRQFPAPGAVVVNTGAPLIALTLERNPRYPEQGTPQDESPYQATVVLLPETPAKPRLRKPGGR